MALACTAGSDDEDRGMLMQVAAGSEVVHECAVQPRQPLEVELLEGLGGAELGTPQASGELLLIAPGDLVADQHGEELGVGELGFDCLAVAGLERVEDAGQTQLLELRGEFRDRIHTNSGGSMQPAGLRGKEFGRIAHETGTAAVTAVRIE